MTAMPTDPHAPLLPLSPPDDAHDIVLLERTGNRYLRCHPPEVCEGHPCPLHSRSDHPMRSWPQNWRWDTQVMERVCSHGVGHPDPDHLASVRARLGAERALTDSVHGCDGCCRIAYPEDLPIGTQLELPFD